MEIDSQHSDMVHDAQFDYYSKLLATCSSDKTIRIHTVPPSKPPSSSAAADGSSSTQQQQQQQQQPASTQPPLILKGHSGPVWQVAWSHPAHNSLLASCSYDGKVIIWNKSQIVHEHEFHSASVNGIAWAPHEYGAVLACASSDGQVSVLQYSQDSWTHSSFRAHSVGVNTVSFCPAVDGELMCVTGGCDNLVKVWKLAGSSAAGASAGGGGGEWAVIATLEGHADWVRSVAWSPMSIATSYKVHTIASCSPDKTVCIWTSVDGVTWEKRQVITHSFPLWRVSWSVTGHLLAVAGSSESTLVYAIDSSSGQWSQIASQNF